MGGLFLFNIFYVFLHIQLLRYKMATQSTDITFTSVVSKAAANLTLTDTSTYSAGDLSWASGDSRILVKIVDPLGSTVQDNTDTSNPDISTGGGSVSINLPTTNGDIIAGDYIVTLTYFDVGTPLTQFDRGYTFTYNYTRPTVDLSITNSVINPIYFKSVDNTDYSVNSVTPTITRSHILYYPPSVGGFYSTTSSTLSVSTFYTGSGEVKLTPTTSYAFTSGYYNDATGTAVNWTLIDTWSKVEDYTVSGVSSSCDLECCLSELQAQVDSSKGKSSYDANLGKFNYASSLVTLINKKFDCNKSQEATPLIEEFKRVTGCTNNCGCDSDSVQVIGIGTTPSLTRKGIVLITADVTSYTFAELVNFNFTNGDFFVSIDGANPETLGGYVLDFNTATGELQFGTTVFTGTKVAWYIIKP